jgi:hypothetical protein
MRQQLEHAELQHSFLQLGVDDLGHLPGSL